VLLLVTYLLVLVRVLFSILFNNTKKRDSKGDLDISGKNVELKASTKGAGAVIAKGYNRGDWSTTKRKGRFEEFIRDLGMDEESTQDALKYLEKALNGLPNYLLFMISIH
jgi:hypothetical protein